VSQFEGKEAATLQAARVEERLGRALALERKSGEAREVLDKAILKFRATTGPTHQALASALLDLGELEMAEGRANKAAARFEEALAIRTKAMFPGAWEITLAESSLARARGDASRSRTLMPALNRCAGASYECRSELQRVRKAVTESTAEQAR
jgi:tetratricopeptide (TPR) repeat protein